MASSMVASVAAVSSSASSSSSVSSAASALPSQLLQAAADLADLGQLAQAILNNDMLDHSSLLARAALLLDILFPPVTNRVDQVFVNEHAQGMDSLLQQHLASEVLALGATLMQLPEFSSHSPRFNKSLVQQWVKRVRYIETHPFIEPDATYTAPMLAPWKAQLPQGGQANAALALAMAGVRIAPPTASPRQPILRNPVAAVAPSLKTAQAFLSTLSNGRTHGHDPSALDALDAALEQEREAMDEQAEEEEDDEDEESTDASESDGDLPPAQLEPPTGYHLSPAKLAQLNPELESFCMERRLSHAELNARGVLLQRLNALVSQRIDRSLGVVVFGSSASGTATIGSDMDCAIVTTAQGVANPNIDAKRLMHALARAVRALPNLYSHVQPIFHARVPILKFQDRASGVSVDLALGQQSTAAKSALMAGYSAADSRVAPLLTLVKAWAKAHDLNDASRNTLNSFGYALLVVQYLQIVQPRVVASLQQPHLAHQLQVAVQASSSSSSSSLSSSSSSANSFLFVNATLVDPQLPIFLSLPHAQRCFVSPSPPPPAPSTSTSPPPPPPLTLAELLVDFFHFFGHRFDSTRAAVCIRSGSLAHKASYRAEMVAANPKVKTVLTLVDPFDPSDNVARGITQEVWLRIQTEMRRAAAGLVATGQFRSILNASVRPPSKHQLKNERRKANKLKNKVLQAPQKLTEKQTLHTQLRHAEQQLQQVNAQISHHASAERQSASAQAPPQNHQLHQQQQQLQPHQFAPRIQQQRQSATGSQHTHSSQSPLLQNQQQPPPLHHPHPRSQQPQQQPTPKSQPPSDGQPKPRRW